MDWSNLKYFKSKEFDSPDEPGSGNRMNDSLVYLLEEMRTRLGFPMIVTSGFRTIPYNKKVNGKPNSAHLRGLAADISVVTSPKRHAILKEAYSLGIPRIEIAPKHIHLDIDPSLPQEVTIFLPSYSV